MYRFKTICYKALDFLFYLHYNTNKKEGTSMTKIKSLISKLAAGTAFFFSAILFVGANTASSGFLHQPKAPESLRRFSKIK